MSEQREIVMTEEQEALLKTAMRIDERRRLPAAARELFGEIKIAFDRVGVHYVSPEILGLIPVLLNRVARPEPKTFFDEVQEHGDVKYGVRVVAKFRNKWQAGIFHAIEKGKVIVQLDDDTAEERKLGPTAVRLATKDDLRKIGE